MWSRMRNPCNVVQPGHESAEHAKNLIPRRMERDTQSIKSLRNCKLAICSPCGANEVQTRPKRGPNEVRTRSERGPNKARTKPWGVLRLRTCLKKNCRSYDGRRWKERHNCMFGSLQHRVPVLGNQCLRLATRNALSHKIICMIDSGRSGDQPRSCKFHGVSPNPSKMKSMSTNVAQ